MVTLVFQKLRGATHCLPEDAERDGASPESTRGKLHAALVREVRKQRCREVLERVRRIPSLRDHRGIVGSSPIPFAFRRPLWKLCRPVCA